MVIIVPKRRDDERNGETPGVSLHKLKEKNAVATQVVGNKMAEYLNVFLTWGSVSELMRKRE